METVGALETSIVTEVVGSGGATYAERVGWLQDNQIGRRLLRPLLAGALAFRFPPAGRLCQRDRGGRRAGGTSFLRPGAGGGTCARRLLSGGPVPHVGAGVGEADPDRQRAAMVQQRLAAAVPQRLQPVHVQSGRGGDRGLDAGGRRPVSRVERLRPTAGVRQQRGGATQQLVFFQRHAPLRRLHRRDAVQLRGRAGRTGVPDVPQFPLHARGLEHVLARRQRHAALGPALDRQRLAESGDPAGRHEAVQHGRGLALDQQRHPVLRDVHGPAVLRHAGHGLWRLHVGRAVGPAQRELQRAAVASADGGPGALEPPAGVAGGQLRRVLLGQQRHRADVQFGHAAGGRAVAAAGRLDEQLLGLRRPIGRRAGDGGGDLRFRGPPDRLRV